MISEERKRSQPAEHVDIVGDRPIFVQGRSAMYPLPIKGGYGRSYDLVLRINDDFALLNAAGTSSAAGSGIGIIVILILLSLKLILSYIIFLEVVASSGVDWFISAVSVVFFLVFLVANVVLIREIKRQVIGFPLLASRRTGRVVQLQGNRRVEADWESLRPYIEPVTSVSSVGASTSCNVHLIQPSENGRSAVRQFLLQNALGIYDCLATYEFLASYMEGAWDELPDIYLLPGARPSFWDAYRHGFFNGWIGVPHWQERSPSSRRWMWFFTPLWTAVFWPLVMLTIAGTRTGRVLRFSDSEIAQAMSGATETVTAALRDKIKAPQPLQPGEKLLYWVSMISGGALWGAFAVILAVIISGGAGADAGVQ